MYLFIKKKKGQNNTDMEIGTILHQLCTPVTCSSLEDPSSPQDKKINK